MSKFTIKELNNIFSKLGEQLSNPDNLDKIIIKGLFVLAVSALEIMISDILTYYLKSFPQKLKGKSFTVTKQNLFSHSPLESQIKTTIHDLSYTGIDSQIHYLCSTLSIGKVPNLDEYISAIVEIKATRNLLLHNDLVVNEAYIESAGAKRRSSEEGGHLHIDTQYFLNSIESVHQFINAIETELGTVYVNYTKVNMLENLWEFMFNSPMMVFENYWVIDEIKDEIPALKHFEHESSLSHSEQMKLGMWRAHFNDNPDNIQFFNMKSLDSNNRSKILFFLSKANEIRFY